MTTQIRNFFTGEFEHSIDSVNRLVIPAKWRSGQTEEFFIFARDEGRLVVLTHGEVQKMIEDIQSTPNMSAKEKTEQSRSLFSSAFQLTCDKQGRITMDAKLLQHAGLKDSVVFVGVGQRFEIWNPKAWGAKKASNIDPNRNAVLDRFGI